MSIKENKALIRHMYDLLSMRKLDAFFGCFSPECVTHNSTLGNSSMDQVKERITGFFTAFPDIKITLKDMVAEGNKVAVLVNWKATHKGVYMGISATGKKIDITVAMLIKINNGKWVEFWNVTDIRLAQQLGTVPK